MRLSAAIATFNEEKNIIRCLKSVYNWVDEIVIVDGNSTDKTVEIIKRLDKHHKTKFFIEENPPMFHANKQKAIERCTGDWILQLDADEVVSEELKNEIRTAAVLETSPSGTAAVNVAFWLPRLNFFLGQPLKKGGQYPDYTLRLYRNGVAKFPCKNVHEQVTVDPTVTLNSFQDLKKMPKQVRHDNITMEQSNNEAIGYLKAPLLHYPYPTFSEYLNKWNRYTSLEAENLKKQGFKPSFFNFIKYFCILPKYWFFKTYLRHLGFLDCFPGFVFSLFSAIRFWGIYVNLLKKYTNKDAAAA